VYMDANIMESTPARNRINIKFLELKGSVKEPNMFHNYETEKITRNCGRNN